MTGAELLVIPLVALAIPIVLVLSAFVFDAAFLVLIVYRGWHEQAHARG